MGQISYRGFNYMCKILFWKEGRERKERKEEREGGKRRGGRKRSGANMAKFYYTTELDG